MQSDDSCSCYDNETGRQKNKRTLVLQISFVVQRIQTHWGLVMICSCFLQNCQASTTNVAFCVKRTSRVGFRTGRHADEAVIPEVWLWHCVCVRVSVCVCVCVLNRQLRQTTDHARTSISLPIRDFQRVRPLSFSVSQLSDQ